jgi:hypothetical protein
MIDQFQALKYLFEVSTGFHGWVARAKDLAIPDTLN